MRRFRASVYRMKKGKQFSPRSFAFPYLLKSRFLPKINRKLRSNKYDDLSLLNEMIKIFNREETMWAPKPGVWLQGFQRTKFLEKIGKFFGRISQTFSRIFAKTKQNFPNFFSRKCENFVKTMSFTGAAINWS